MDDIAGMPPLERVIGRLDEKALRLPGSTDYPCPACGSSGFSIRSRSDGRVQLTCQYSCPIDAILAALGLRPSDLFPSPPVQGQGEGLGKGKGYIEGSVSYTAVPCTGKAEPELRGLLESYRRGAIEPRPVRLGYVPPGATDDMCRVAMDIELLMGLRAAVFEDRPLPYSTRFCAERLGWGSNCARASRAIRKLEVVGVIECVGSMPPRPGMPFGTKLYAPPSVVAADGERPVLRSVERRDVA